MKVEKEEVIAGVTGAGIGVASVGVSFIGANAAAMSSGLAATVVGGGMALGIVVVSAAPVLLGAAGFATVKGYKKYKAKNK